MSQSVVIGFGNWQGQISKKLLEEKFKVIQRLNIKASVAPPRVTAKRFEDIDLGIYKALITKRKNQMLLQSFIGMNDPWQESDSFSKLRQEAKNQINTINEELSTGEYLAANNKCIKFIENTKSSEDEAKEYLNQFHGDLETAIKKYNERVAIINQFAQKHKIPVIEAKRTLKDNKYNTAVFD